jgi:hypothetical protein
VLTGVGSVLALPLAVYLTRFSDSYELLHAAFVIPVGALLGVAAIALSRRARRRTAVSLVASGSNRAATAGRVLGVAGLCLAAAALIALAVYGLLEYAGTRD